MKLSRIVTFATGMFVGITLGLVAGHAAQAKADPATCWQLQGTLIQIACPLPEEDDLGWDCVRNGNRICGPDNTQGRPAGCYDELGLLVAPWPCHVVINADGSSDVYDGGQR